METELAEYTEANQSARQIDDRIWNIYGIYFALLAGGLAVLLQEKPLHPAQELVVLAGLVLASISQMALVGHLQSFSDRIYDRVREIERKLGLRVHEIFEPSPSPSERLWGLHRWLSRYRARDVMQIWGLWVIGVAIVRGSYVILKRGGTMDPKTLQAIAETAQSTILWAIGIICGTSLITTLLTRDTKQLKSRNSELEIDLERAREPRGKS